MYRSTDRTIDALACPSDSWVTTVSQLRAPQLFDLLFVGEGPRDKEVTARGR
jgi:hypothetical protein